MLRNYVPNGASSVDAAKFFPLMHDRIHNSVHTEFMKVTNKGNENMKHPNST